MLLQCLQHLKGIYNIVNTIEKKSKLLFLQSFCDVLIANGILGFDRKPLKCDRETKWKRHRATERQSERHKPTTIKKRENGVEMGENERESLRRNPALICLPLVLQYPIPSICSPGILNYMRDWGSIFLCSNLVWPSEMITLPGIPPSLCAFSRFHWRNENWTISLKCRLSYGMEKKMKWFLGARWMQSFLCRNGLF